MFFGSKRLQLNETEAVGTVEPLCGWLALNKQLPVVDPGQVRFISDGPDVERSLAFRQEVF